MAFGFALAVVTSPVTLIIAGLLALAAAGIYLYQNWEAVKGYLVDIWEGLKDAAQAAWDGIKQSASDAWEGLKTSAGSAWDSVKQAGQGAWDSLKQAGADAWEGAKTKGGEFIEWLKNLPSSIGTALGDLGGKMLEAGSKAIQGLLDGMVQKFDALIEWVKGIPERIIAAIGNIDITSMIKWPTPPAWLSKLWGGGAEQPSAAGGATDAPAPGATAPKTGAMPATDPMGNPTGFTPTAATGGAIGGSNGFAQRTAQAANSNVQVGGQITVTATGDAKVTNVQSSNPAVPVTPNRGTMVGRV